MADANTEQEEQVQWTVAEVATEGGGDGDGQVDPVYVAMQPVGNDSQVEVQEVVIVTEGGEELAEVHEVTSFPEGIQAYDQKTGQIISVVSEEIIQEELQEQIEYVPEYVPLPIITETTQIPDDKKLLFQQLQRSEAPKALARSPRGRPPGRPPKTHFSYRPKPKLEPEEEDDDDDDFPAPARVSTPHFPRSRGGKSLSRMPKPEPPIQSSSETDSDSDSEVNFRRLHQGGMPGSDSKKKPKPRDFAHRLQWRNRDMLEAMKAVEEQKMTIRGAAKKYNVPYSTLKDRVHGRVRHGAKPGVKTILSPEEEEELAKFVRDMENAGFQLRCIDVRDRAAELLRLNHGHNSPYKDGSPGHNWFHGFVKRHPGLEFKRTVKKNIVPSISKQKHMLRRFYDITANIYKKYKLSHKSDRIFSVSELRIGGHFEATILYAAAANGSMIPPFVIFKGNSLKLTSARQEYPEAFFTCSYDGRVNEDIFLWWFRDHFLKRVPTGPARPGILYVSRAVNDITIQTVQLAKEDRMNLVGMTFGISHLVQPLDDDVSDMIRGAFNRRFTKWQDDNPGIQVTQVIVAQILRKVWTKVDPEEIAAKFTANGIYPLNAYAVTQDKLITGAHILREMVEHSPPRQLGASPQLSGLNLLSALSSQEYATLDYNNGRSGSGDYAGNQSFETQSDTSINESIRSDKEQRVAENHGYKVVIKSHPGKENEVMVVPMSEVAEEDVVEEQVEITSDMMAGAEGDGEEIVETEVISEPTQEQVEELLQTQRELKRKRPRPTTDILERHTDVRTEIIAARENEDQISKAIDSILDHRDQETTGRGTMVKIEKRDSPVPPEPKRIKIMHPTPTPVSLIQSHKARATSQSIHIAPDRIKEEISKAIRSGSFGGPNAVQLSDFQGNDIKIQIRIQNPDSSSASTTPSSSRSRTSFPKTPTTTVTTSSHKPPVPRSPVRIIRSGGSGPLSPGRSVGLSGGRVTVLRGPGGPVSRAEATEAVVRKAGGFIKVSDPSRRRQNFVIQSSQIRAKTEDFSPIIKSVEAVGDTLPSYFLDDIEEDQGFVVADPNSYHHHLGGITAQRVVPPHRLTSTITTIPLPSTHSTHRQTEEVVMEEAGVVVEEEVEEAGVMVMDPHDTQQVFTADDGQQYIISNADDITTTTAEEVPIMVTSMGGDSGDTQVTELVTEDGQTIMVTSQELVGGGGEEVVEAEVEEGEAEQCVVQYVNEHGEIIEVKEVNM